MAESTLKRVLLIRHGQTDWNVAGRWQGVLQIPLNQEGIEQAHALAESLTGRPITAIYSSDLIRASLTARIIGDVLGLPVHEDARLRELDLGAFQGLTFPEITAQFPAETEVMKHNYMEFIPPDGESRQAMQARAYECYQEILQRETGDEVVMVSHGGTIRVLLMKLFGEEAVHQIHVGNTSVTVIETDGVTHRLIDRAGVEHLDKNPKLTTRDDV